MESKFISNLFNHSLDPGKFHDPTYISATQLHLVRKTAAKTIKMNTNVHRILL